MRVALALAALVALNVPLALADETVVSSVDLFGIASEDQEIVYHPSKSEYEQARDEIFARLEAGDKTAFVNPSDGPWMRVETTAKVGFVVKGITSADGSKQVRQISAADAALFNFQQGNR